MKLEKSQRETIFFFKLSRLTTVVSLEIHTIAVVSTLDNFCRELTTHGGIVIYGQGRFLTGT